MGSLRYVGAAPAIAQVESYLFAGAWIATETVTFAYGNRTFTVAVGSTVIATIVTNLVVAYEALSSTVYPEFTEQTAAVGATNATLKLTADTPGKAFICTISTNSAAGTIDGGASSAGTATVANSGPSDVGRAANYSGNALPVNGDDLTIDGNVDLLYSLNALSGVLLATLNIPAIFTANIGLPETSADGTAYFEYRPTYFAVKATLEDVGAGQGRGSGRIKRDAGSAQTTLSVHATGVGLEANLEALQWKGTHASNTVRLYGGSVALAGYAGEAATVSTLTTTAGASVRVGAGVTLGTLTMQGGGADVACALTTAILENGAQVVFRGTGAATTVTVDSGVLSYQSSGTLGTLTVGNRGVVSFNEDGRAKTVTNTVQMYAGAQVIDDGAVVTWGGTPDFNLNRCRIEEVVIRAGIGRGVTLT